MRSFVRPAIFKWSEAPHVCRRQHPCNNTRLKAWKSHFLFAFCSKETCNFTVNSHTLLMNKTSERTAWLTFTNKLPTTSPLLNPPPAWLHRCFLLISLRESSKSLLEKSEVTCSPKQQRAAVCNTSADAQSVFTYSSLCYTTAPTTCNQRFQSWGGRRAESSSIAHSTFSLDFWQR